MRDQRGDVSSDGDDDNYSHSSTARGSRATSIAPQEDGGNSISETLSVNPETALPPPRKKIQVPRPQKPWSARGRPAVPPTNINSLTEHIVPPQAYRAKITFGSLMATAKYRHIMQPDQSSRHRTPDLEGVEQLPMPQWNVHRADRFNTFDKVQRGAREANRPFRPRTARSASRPTSARPTSSARPVRPATAASATPRSPRILPPSRPRTAHPYRYPPSPSPVPNFTSPMFYDSGCSSSTGSPRPSSTGKKQHPTNNNSRSFYPSTPSTPKRVTSPNRSSSWHDGPGSGSSPRQAQPHQEQQPLKPKKKSVLNTPLRIHPPGFMNLPPRRDRFSDTLTAKWGSRYRSADGSGSRQLPERSKTVLDKIADCNFRAQACRRAGRKRAEANAYFCMGIMYDNIAEHQKAVGAYRAFAEALVTDLDSFAQSLSLNSIGISYSLLGPKYINKALDAHSKHAAVADIPGKFVAHSNLGMCFGLLGDAQSSSKHHKEALRYAIAMQSLGAQSVAVGNLGMAGASHDADTARDCFERHLELSASLGDNSSHKIAYSTLGSIAAARGEFLAAAEHFRNAIHAGQQTGQQTEHERVQMAIAAAKSDMEAKMQNMSEMVMPG